MALRLVFVTPGDRKPAATVSLIEAVLEGGVTALLLRERQLPPDERAALYEEATACAHAAGALALVSGDVRAARACGADGVHLGHGSPSVAQARAAGGALLVGRSCHWPVTAEDRAADYITLSPFAPTHRSHPRPLLTASQIASALADPALGPIVALGGLDARAVPDLPDGLAGVAVIRALADARDPRGAAATLRSVVDGRWQFGTEGA